MSESGTLFESMGRHEHGKQGQLRRRSWWRALIQDFSPIWFTWCMNTGIIGIVLHNFPYHFHGIGVLSTIAYLVDFILFIIFTLIFLARFALYGRSAYLEITNQASELSLLGCWPIGWLTLAALTCLIVSTAGWGGHAFTIVGYVMWWIGAGWIVALNLFVLVTMIRRRSAALDAGGQLPPLVVIPAVGVATLATTGGLIASYSFHISARMAVPVIIFCFLSVGIGIFLVAALYTLLLHNLFATGWPAPEQITSMFVLVGPMGQSAAALQLLGNAANTYMRFAGYHQGTFLTQSAAQPLQIACILLALLLMGMAAIWALLALYATLECAYNRQLSWNPAWNGIVFPLGTVTTSCIMLSIEMDSPAWRTVSAGLIIIMVIVFFVNVVGTVYRVSKGQLLVVRDDPRLDAKAD